MKRKAGILLIMLGFAWMFFLYPKHGLERQADQMNLPLNDPLKQIAVQAANSNIRVIPEDRDDLKFTLEGSGTLAVHSTDDQILVSASRKRWSLFPWGCTLVIHIPVSYHGPLAAELSEGDLTLSGGSSEHPLQLKSIRITAVSGTVDLSDLQAEQVGFHAASGSFHGKGVKTGQLNVQLNTGSMKLHRVSGNVTAAIESGEVQLNQLQTGKAVIQMTRGGVSVDQYSGELNVSIGLAGEIMASNVNASSSNLEVGSGEIHADQFTGKLRAAAQAGEIKVGFGQLTEAADFNMGKGRVQLNFPRNSNLIMDAVVQKGDLDNRYLFAGYDLQTERAIRAVSGSGTIPVNVKVSSGEISLR